MTKSHKSDLMSERMERKKMQKRMAILDKAEKLIAKKGYWDMTIDEVAAEADVAKGTVYLYFNSKEAVCAAVMARVIANMNTYIRQRLENVDGGSRRVQLFGNAVFEWAASNPEKMRVLDNASSLRFKDPSDENVQEMLRMDNEQIQIMRDNYRQAIEEGSIRPDIDPMPTAIFMRMAAWVAMNPFPSNALLMEINGVDREQLLRNARDLLLYATHTDAKKWIVYDVPSIKKAKSSN
jgi:AcrR family transcriptional regulator